MGPLPHGRGSEGPPAEAGSGALKRAPRWASLALLLAAPALAQDAAPVDAAPAGLSADQTRLAVSLYEEGSFAGGLLTPGPWAANLLLAQPSFSWRHAQRWRLSASLAAIGSTTGDTHGQLRVREAWGGLTAGDFDFSLGKKILRWGTGYAFTPTGVLDPPRNPIDPTDRLSLNEGREMVAVDWVSGRHALTAVWASAGVFGTPRAGITDTTALRYNTLIAGFDSALIFAHDSGRPDFYGANFTRVVGEALEVHGEFARRDSNAVLLGGKYMLRSGVNTIFEWYSPPAPRLGPLRVSQRGQVPPARAAGLEAMGCLAGPGRQHHRSQPHPDSRCHTPRGGPLLAHRAHPGSGRKEVAFRVWYDPVLRPGLDRVPVPDMNVSRKPGTYRRHLLRLPFINLGAAVIATLALVGVEYPVSVGFVVNTFLVSLVYSFTIGGMAGLLLPLIAEKAHLCGSGKKIAVVVVSIIVLTVAGCALATVILVQVGLRPAADAWSNFWGIVRFCIVISLLVGLGVYFFESMRYRLAEASLELRTRQLGQERAQKLATEARLSSLESRIHPHFLFNTLNSISALIHDEPQRAEQIVGRLAALLRFSLDANQCSLVPLEQEFKIVRDYLEIEKARFGDRLRYSIDVAPEARQSSLPPLAVESLVENSVKHAIAPRREGGEVRVSARAVNGGIEIEVADSGPGFSLEAIPRGHGIDNLLARLEVLYNGQARLDVGTENGRASVRLILPGRV